MSIFYISWWCTVSYKELEKKEKFNEFKNNILLNIKSGDLLIADKALSQAMKEHPNHPDLHYLRGLVCLKNEDCTRAEGFLNVAVYHEPSNIEYWRLLAEIRIENFNVDGAEEALEKAVAIDEKDNKTLLLIGKLHFQKGDYIAAERLGDRIIRQSGKDYDALRLITNCHINTGASAEKILKELMELRKIGKDKLLDYDIARFMFFTGQNDECIKQCKKIIVKYPQSQIAFEARGLIRKAKEKSSAERVVEEKEIIKNNEAVKANESKKTPFSQGRDNNSNGKAFKVFSNIEEELKTCVIGQKDYIKKLCISFKRSLLSCSEKSYKGLIIVCGPKGSGRHYTLKKLVEAMKNHGIAGGGISCLDLSKYSTEKSCMELFLPDIYKAFCSKDDVIVLENIDKTNRLTQNMITSLGLDGRIKLDKRYAGREGNLSDVTGSLLSGTIDEISCKDKYIVLLTNTPISKVSELFPAVFIDKVSDLLSTEMLTEGELSLLAASFLEEYREKIEKTMGLDISYTPEVREYIIGHMRLSDGAYGVREYIEEYIYKPFVELVLNENILSQSCYIFIKDDLINAKINGVEHDLSYLIKRKDEEGLKKIEEELSAVIGLDEVKNFMNRLKKNIEVQKVRTASGQKSVPMSLHMVFTGNPGTGKTTIARLVSRYLKSMGYLSSGHLVEVGRSDLVGQYVGETAQKTMGVIHSALGGVLFIDEAYSLVRDKKDTFGIEAVDTIVKAIEDNRDNLIVIIAGYTKDMNEFLKSNQGLSSRFNYRIEFQDYSSDELLKIIHSMAHSQGYLIDGKCDDILLKLFEKYQVPGSNDGGNGRLARNMLEKAITRQSERIADKVDADKDDIVTLCEEDFEDKNTKATDFDLEKQLSGIIGLDEVKEYMRSLQAQLRIKAERRRFGLDSDSAQTLHMIFKGNPGTGKTMIARITAKILHEMGVLSGDNFVETDRSGLVAGHVGQTAIKTRQVIESALDGVLFIDEAYALCQGTDNDFGREAINTLVKAIDDYRDRLVVVLAGYSEAMDEFLSINPGLRSRFPAMIEFPDYNTDELMHIAKEMISNIGCRITKEAEEKLQGILDKARQNNHFGNGRYVRNIIELAQRNQAVRLKSNADNLDRETLITFEASDIQEV